MSTAAELEDLVTGAEIGRRLSLSTQRVHQLAAQPGFPRPLGRVGNYVVWRWADVELWNDRRGWPATANADLDQLDVSEKTRNVLRRIGLVSLGDLASKTRAQLEQVPHFSKSAIADAEQALARHGLRLRG